MTLIFRFVMSEQKYLFRKGNKCHFVSSGPDKEAAIKASRFT